MNSALKEWFIILSAMEQGYHSLILRKGGMADKKGEFTLEHSEFFLFQTYEHQSKEFIRGEFQNLFEANREHSFKEEIKINLWAQCIQSTLIQSNKDLEGLESDHIWSDQYLRMRLEYKPEKPLYLVRLKIFQLRAPRVIENLKKYGGCRSWVTLEENISTEDSFPIPSKINRARNM